MIFGHPTRVLSILRRSQQDDGTVLLDLSGVALLALDDTELMIQENLIDDVCEICTVLKHFSQDRIKHVILSHYLTREARTMLRVLRTSLIRQQNLFGLQDHQTKARARVLRNYVVEAPKEDWPDMLRQR